ncbi:MAG: hypothetical protein JAY85_12715, partial [Candidatus Thiodiazotropha weberae]|nr:hypothetical protein [Candidatus Thiodiazotropha weberae]
MNDSSNPDLRSPSGEADSDPEAQAEFSERRELLVSFLWLFIPVSIVLAGIFYAFSNQTQKYELQTA